jgi:hypothetical protein
MSVRASFWSLCVINLVCGLGCGRSGLLQSNITVTPLAMPFGDVQLHGIASQTLSLSNTGLTSDVVRLNGPDGGPFAWAEMTFSLGTHASIDIPVSFSPTELGAASATLHMTWGEGNFFQDVALSGNGLPFPCEADSPDGTPCQLWWAPCALGAACLGGVCHSATAEAEMPGDLRWTFPVTGATALAADFEGNVFSRTVAGVLALDACGKMRWQNQTTYDSLLLGGDTLVGSTTTGQLAGLSRRDGSLLWSAEVGQLLGCSGSGAPCSSLQVSPPVLTHQGSLFVYATSVGAAGGETLSRLDFALDGGLLGVASVSEPSGFAVGSVVGDIAGNTYLSTYVDGMLENIVSLDLGGNLRFEVKELNDPHLFAVSQTVLVGASTVWSLDGTTTADIPSPDGTNIAGCGNPGAVDSSGTLYCFTVRDMPYKVMAVTPGPASLWASALPMGSLAKSNLVLGDPGELFVYTKQMNNPSENLLVAMLAADGGLAWTAQPFQSQGMATNFALTLTPAATLVTSDQTAIYGVFAGQIRVPATAFWSRFGGDCTNRAVPAPTAGQ